MKTLFNPLIKKGLDLVREVEEFYSVLDTRYLNKTGDTMMGLLNLNYQGIQGLFDNMVVLNKNGGADATTFAEAVAKANALSPSSGNQITILVMPGSFSEIVTIPAYVNLIGLYPGAVINTAPAGSRGPVFTFAGNQTIANINANHYPTGWTYTTVKATGSVTLYNCNFKANGSDTNTTCYAFGLISPANGTFLTAYNSTFTIANYGASSPAIAAGLYISGTQYVNLDFYGCTFTATKSGTGGGNYYGIYFATRMNWPWDLFNSVIGGSTAAMFATVAMTGPDAYGSQFFGGFSNIAPRLVDTDIKTGITNVGNAVLQASNADSVPWRVQGSNGQAANLQTWEDSSANVLTAIDSSGKLLFGADTNLYRSGANTLKTDDTFDAFAYKVNGSAGVSGTFTTTDGKTITVTNGIVTNIV